MSCRRLFGSYRRRIGCRRQFREGPRAAEGDSELLIPGDFDDINVTRKMRNQGGKERRLFDKLGLRCW